MANLSEKELSFLEDQLSAEQLLIKKFKAISAEASDAEIKTCCDPDRKQASAAFRHHDGLFELERSDSNEHQSHNAG